MGSSTPVCAINNADDCLSYSCGTFLRAHLPDINYLFFFYPFPIYSRLWPRLEINVRF